MSKYPLNTLLDRIYTDIKKSNVTAIHRVKLVPPIVKILNRKTHIYNFTEIAKSFNKDRLILQKYFNDELKVKSSIAENGSLTVTGIFRENNIRSILYNYYKTYVACSECLSNKTEVVKKNRIQFLKCHQCKSEKAIN